MCLIVLACRCHSEYPLIIAANRDEFYDRPTAPLAFWNDHSNILAGRDLQGKGTWLGVSRSGRIAAITNYRDPASLNPDAPSRGLLVSRFLLSNLSPKAYLQDIGKSASTYNGFNLVAGDLTALFWYSNRNQQVLRLHDGIHGISNHLLDTPWPKLEKAKAALARILSRGPKPDPEAIFEMLADTDRPPDTTLPDTGVGLEWERILSSVFVVSDVYGTRSSAVIILEDSGRLTFMEKAFEIHHAVPKAGETRRFEIYV
jgi:uncharacterized protein with NRDE domain